MDPDNGNGEGNVTDDPNGNVTDVPPPSPVPDIQVAMVAEEESSEAPFIVSPGAVVDFELDGSGSTVENGTIEVYSWIVERPDGDELTGSGGESTFEVTVNGTSTSDYGVYTATLRVLSSENVLEETTLQWTLNYQNTFNFDAILFGPAEAGCDSVNQQQASGALPGLPADVVLGTYGLHTVSTAENITALNITLDYETAAPATSMSLYVFGPETGDPEGSCDDAIAEGDTELTVEDLSESGQYRVQAQMEGLFIEGYTVTVEAIYSVPGDDDDAEEDDEDPEEEE